jgi:hypothetical protein
MSPSEHVKLGRHAQPSLPISQAGTRHVPALHASHCPSPDWLQVPFAKHAQPSSPVWHSSPHPAAVKDSSATIAAAMATVAEDPLVAAPPIAAPPSRLAHGSTARSERGPETEQDGRTHD